MDGTTQTTVEKRGTTERRTMPYLVGAWQDFPGQAEQLFVPAPQAEQPPKSVTTEAALASWFRASAHAKRPGTYSFIRLREATVTVKHEDKFAVDLG